MGELSEGEHFLAFSFPPSFKQISEGLSGMSPEVGDFSSLDLGERGRREAGRRRCQQRRRLSVGSFSLSITLCLKTPTPFRCTKSPRSLLQSKLARRSDEGVQYTPWAQSHPSSRRDPALKFCKTGLADVD